MAYALARRAKFGKQIRALQKAWVAKNREHVRGWQAAYYAANRERLTAKRRDKAARLHTVPNRVVLKPRT